ncbi:D-glycero-beta-D-manno-heptose 1,7-bisphosphate 7-phosphatase [Piscirickettsia salmonis]|uniref:D-glycero-beta-D-manno-heptose 1,7-bisphosphate 7-phosphatase n=1 Tax=Piscirickettsia salmonis TaxID=1238 RepID=UPI0012BAAF73|nr:D-glycero-beta-D-manno-heptose 1,7-bisphosphate 7-phosphatase [Piscirickettsia salmonis]QGP56520.1 D,D-heptose 1,7-bisphosphate phosphatase [Piscirickettsia salmonis]QGP61327.1 D,D-heptose 1,7-bisphosphate phosphatase [Piscirickettsia salmonis]QGP66084.1 D,D-heptose 1,7-bisphosphate phosphatase [Piscirickettsia salmonis]
MQIKPLVILDRDGVINEDSEHYIKSAAEWQPIKHSLTAIAKLNTAHIKVAIATNQSGIYRGYFTLATLHDMHKKMAHLLAEQHGHIDHIEYCPHGPTEGCSCRKPAPGMLKTIITHFQLTPEHAYFIGDSFKDIQAAQAIGCSPILVLSGKGGDTLKKHPELEKQIKIFHTLNHFVTELLANANTTA